MRTTEEHEHGEQMADKCGGPHTKKKRFAIAVAASLVLLLLAVIIWRRQASDVNSVLALAGLACLPDSAENVMIDREGGILDVRVTFVKFTASADDILTFIQGSGIHTPGSRPGEGSGFLITRGITGRLRSLLARVLRARPQSINHPSWWIKDRLSPGLLQYRRSPNRYDQVITVDHGTNTVYIRLWRS